MTAATIPAAVEIRRLRAELAEVTRQRGAMLRADDPLTDAARRQVAEAAYEGGRVDGFREGYAQSEADTAAAWHAMTEPIAHPERGAARRIQAAVAGERRGAAEHERAFVARAYNTADRDRTDAQRGTVHIYPPPRGAR
jgi:hypothetical protein